MTKEELTTLKKECEKLATAIDKATLELVSGRLNKDADRARKAELRLLCLAGGCQQTLTYIVERI